VASRLLGRVQAMQTDPRSDAVGSEDLRRSHTGGRTNTVPRRRSRERANPRHETGANRFTGRSSALDKLRIQRERLPVARLIDHSS
jgi:hypothetical protein